MDFHHGLGVHELTEGALDLLVLVSDLAGRVRDAGDFIVQLRLVLFGGLDTLRRGLLLPVRDVPLFHVAWNVLGFHLDGVLILDRLVYDLIDLGLGRGGLGLRQDGRGHRLLVVLSEMLAHVIVDLAGARLRGAECMEINAFEGLVLLRQVLHEVVRVLHGPGELIAILGLSNRKPFGVLRAHQRHPLGAEPVLEERGQALKRFNHIDIEKRK